MNPKPLELTPEQLERIRLRKERDEGVKVSPEWRLVAEFGYYFGWSGVEAVMNNDIDIGVFNNLLAGARKVWYGRVLDLSAMTYTSVGATKTKKPKSFMDKGLAFFRKEVRP